MLPSSLVIHKSRFPLLVAFGLFVLKVDHFLFSEYVLSLMGSTDETLL